MKIAGQVGPGLPTRKGQLLVKTTCGKCGASFSNPTQASVHHVRQHEAEKLKPSEGKPIWTVRWNRDGSLGEVLRGPKPPNNDAIPDPDPFSATITTATSENRETPYVALIWGLYPHRCIWCGRQVKRREAEGHHLTPREWGGTDDPKNLAIVHAKKCHDAIEAWTEEQHRPFSTADRRTVALTSGS